MAEVQLLPTPENGLPIWYYPDDQNIKDPQAAICTKIEGPGKVGLIVFSHNMEGRYISGVYWAGDDRRLDPSRPFKRAGVFDFMPALKPRNVLAYHQAELARQESAAAAHETAFRLAAEAREKAHEARKKAVANG
jgi:hypothetical protein